MRCNANLSFFLTFLVLALWRMKPFPIDIPPSISSHALYILDKLEMNNIVIFPCLI